MKPIFAFIAGCVLTGMLVGLYANDLKVQLRNRENQVVLQLKQANQQSDACREKFSRTTILYVRPTGLFGVVNRNVPPVKSWVIPADVEPAYTGPSEGLFSHYDPKTQVETVKFDAKQ